MKNPLLFLVIIFYSITACNTMQESEIKLFKCTCEEIPDLGDSTQAVQKIKYTYFVESTDMPNCCTENVNSKHTGYKTIWENEAPDNPTVWKRVSSKPLRIDAEEAQKRGCAFQNKNVIAVELDDPPSVDGELY
jgi:hypothetical protein